MFSQKEKIAELDSELVSIIKDFVILKPLSWPKDAMVSFLNSVKANSLQLPEFTYPKVSYIEQISALKQYIKKLGRGMSPSISFLRQTAESYLDAYYILDNIGTKTVNEFSRKLYGSPKDLLPGYNRRNVDVARYLARVIEGYKCSVDYDVKKYTAVSFLKLLKSAIAKEIKLQDGDSIDVNIDDHISARAAAGPNYVKVRSGTRFSNSDLAQLLHHEVMIHTLTYLNGRKQKILKTLGYSAPRTAATQEGLAVFAEYINLSIELERLHRIALRIIAIDMAEKGADFIDLFRFFNKHSRDDEESFYSAMRIFRGGYAKGGVIFYKDNIYLKGLIEVESFLKHAMHNGKIQDIMMLFCGKLTTDDVFKLKPLINEGIIDEPCYLPQWIKNSSNLASHLALNDLTERFKIK